ncbi:MAG: aldolase [Sphaerochaetaceae bacterium]|jgi:class I fructose-bisphosphate aldolase|nr:aldolase [Sphaerochaetaceae bacterium]NLO60563.1 aldolase [Spirochaetales bacterium]MDD2406445.1 aldolase [Sphaerochaetaceae bacterium]MDD3670870.1 aldolase [Sphaerochaetaceae bacterium]MDD4260292.1 aldolase [Sphaerochaetaceae bacterium]
MKRRMNNILRKDGKTFILAMDHAAIMPSPDLTNPGKIITEAIAGGVDGFLTTYGIIKNFSSSFGNAGIIMRADGGLSTIRKPMAPMELIYSAEDAIRVGADAMLCMGYPGSQANEHSLKYLAKLASDAEKYNLPVGAEMLPYGFERPEGVDTRSVELMAFACQQGAELGADFIKAEFVGGEQFKRITDSCYVPVLVLGGARAKSEEELFSNIRDAIDCGSKGIIMGRNIVRHKNIAQMCEAIAAIVHDNITVEQALGLLK